MLPEITQFGKWLRRRNPQASTHVHYCNDLKLFFSWADKPPDAITLHDVDRYIDRCQQAGHATATINRRLTAIGTFYRFLNRVADDAPSNPILPDHHFVRRGVHLPRDARDDDIECLFAVVHSTRDRAIYQLMIRCGLRVGEIRRLSMGDLYLHPQHHTA